MVEVVDKNMIVKIHKETCKTDHRAKYRKLPVSAVLSVRLLILSVVTNTCMFVQVNLMQYMKLSTSRDFRINAASLDAAMQEQDDSQEVSAISYWN